MKTTLYIGQKFSMLRKFSKEEVLQFSKLSGDKNPLHWDEEFCKNTIFKSPICHGMLGSSLFSNLMGNNITGSIYISQTLKFLRPVYIDEEIEAFVEIDEFNRTKNILQLRTYVIKTSKNEKAIDGEAFIKIPKEAYIVQDSNSLKINAEYNNESKI